MWRLAFVLCLLPWSFVLAGETRGQFSVGLTIVALPKAATVNPTPAAIAIAVPLPKARPAALGSSNTAAGSSWTRP
jgi:hypothetical protein